MCDLFLNLQQKVAFVGKSVYVKFVGLGIVYNYL